MKHIYRNISNPKYPRGLLSEENADGFEPVEIPDSNAELEVRIVDLEKTNKNKQDQINLLTELVNTFGKKVDELLRKGK